MPWERYDGFKVTTTEEISKSSFFSETGRYDPNRENLEMMRVKCTDGCTENHLGQCAAICRSQTDNDLDVKSMKEVI